MTLSTAENVKWKRYTGTGANTALNTVFKFFANSEVEVWSRVTATGAETKLTETTHYTVSGGGASGTQAASTGTVTPVDGATDFPTTVTWEIRRTSVVDQSYYDANEGDSFAALSVEGSFDRASMQVAAANKWALLAQSSGTGLTDMELNSQDWPDLYDAVRIEILGVYPSSAGRLRIKIRDNGGESTSSLFRVMTTAVGSSTSTQESGSGWGSDSTHLVGTSLAEAVNGEVTFHHRNGNLYGWGQYTYTESSGSELTISTVGFHATGSYTRIDGFNLDTNPGTLTGLARLWGMPKA